MINLYSLEAEQAILGMLILDSTAIVKVVNKLKERDFYLPKHQFLYSLMVDKYKNHLPFDLVILADAIRGNKLIKVKYLIELLEAQCSSANIYHYVKIVKELAERRELKEIIKGAVVDIDGSQDITDQIEKISKQIKELDDKVSNETEKKTFASLVGKEILNIGEEEGKGMELPTGLKTIDSWVGGFEAQELYVIAGDTSTGKTALILTFIINLIYKNKRVGLLSLEMGESSVIRRFLTMLSGVSVFMPHTYKMGVGYKELVYEASEELKSKKLYLNTISSTSFAEIRAGLEGQKVDILFVDYLQLLHPPKNMKFETRNREVGYMAAELKEIAKDFNIPVCVASQLTRRENPNRRPILKDLRDSGEIEQSADKVWFIYRPGMQNDKKTISETDLIVAKNRNGETGIRKLYFQFPNIRFRDADYT